MREGAYEDILPSNRYIWLRLGLYTTRSALAGYSLCFPLLHGATLLFLRLTLARLSIAPLSVALAAFSLIVGRLFVRLKRVVLAIVGALVQILGIIGLSYSTGAQSPPATAAVFLAITGVGEAMCGLPCWRPS